MRASFPSPKISCTGRTVMPGMIDAHCHIYPAKITIEPKKNKKSSEPLGVDDIKNAAFLMFESLKNTVLLDKESLELRVVHGTDKDADAVTITTFVIEEDEEVVPWTQALADMSRFQKVDSDALEEFFLHRLPEA